MKNVTPSKRKDKSLALLAQRFLELCMSLDDPVVCLNETAKLLKVERRRIYDIVNIMEVLGVVSRKGKNVYHWMGTENVNKVVLRLKEEAKDQWAKSIGSLNQKQEKVSSPENISAKEAGVKKGSRKEKSLGLLSEKFIHLFFTNDNKDNCVSLDDAALHLMQKDQAAKSSGKLPPEKICMSSGAFKSRVRRLYDIANVLMALGLIEKMFLVSSRKPAFRWVSLLRCPNTNTSVSALTLTKSNKKNSGKPQKRHRPQSIDLVDERTPKSSVKSTKTSETMLSRSNSLTFSFSQPLPQTNTRLKGPCASLSNSAFRVFEAAQSTPSQSRTQAVNLSKILAMKASVQNPFIARYRRVLSSWSGYGADIKSFMARHNRNPPQVSSMAGDSTQYPTTQ